MYAGSEKESEWQRLLREAERAQREGKFDYAETTWSLAIDEAEGFGPHDRRLAYSLEKLTECLWFQGRLRESLDYGARALQIYEAGLGPGHEDVGSMAYNVAMIHHMLNSFPAAEQLYKRALAIKTSNHGAKHPEVVKVLGSFADLLHRLGREDEARQLRATERMVTATNWSHTGAARELGVQQVYVAEDMRPAGASPPPPGDPYVNAAGIASGAYPPVNAAGIASGAYPPVSAGQAPPVQSRLRAIQNAAKQQAASGVPMEQETNLERTHDGADKAAPGQNLEKTAQTQKEEDKSGSDYAAGAAKLATYVSGTHGKSWDEIRTTAEQAMQAEDFQKAEQAWRECLTMAKAENETNPTYCFVLENLGEVLIRQQQYILAEDCLRSAFAIKVSALGEEHQSTAAAASNLARLYFVSSNYAMAESFGDKCVKLHDKLFGANSIEVASALHNLATVFHVQRKYERAEPCYERAMKIKQLQLGNDHPDTVKLLQAYANLLRSTHREEQADMLDKCATGMISGRWRAVKPEDLQQPAEGWWKEEIFGQE